MSFAFIDVSYMLDSSERREFNHNKKILYDFFLLFIS